MQILHIPCLEDNYSYLIIDEATKDAAVVDPVEPHKILRAAQENGVNLKFILTTHHHWDHAGGNEKMKQLVPEIMVFGGSLDNVQACTNKLQNGDTLSLGDHINILSLHTVEDAHVGVTNLIELTEKHEAVKKDARLDGDV